MEMNRLLKNYKVQTVYFYIKFKNMVVYKVLMQKVNTLQPIKMQYYWQKKL